MLRAVPRKFAAILYLVMFGLCAVSSKPIINPDEQQGLHGMSNLNHPNHFVKGKQGHWFQAFPNSKVPVGSLLLVIITVGFSLGFLLITFIISLLWYTPISKSTRSERAQVFSNLRILGICNEHKSSAPNVEDEENVVPLAEELENQASPKKSSPKIQLLPPSSPSDSEHEADAKVGSRYDPNNIVPTSSNEKKKSKDSSELAGPIVPVLRNDDPNVLEDTDSEGEYEDESDNKDDIVPDNTRPNEPRDEAPAPAYEYEPPSQAQTNTGRTDLSSSAVEHTELPPPILGSLTAAPISLHQSGETK
ncbi:hypothetical protein MPSI1_000818 [Malassezia psittaci]|uniref:Uncharacterized protein n=1 Tax=Malassezia psittaci TaxID=1821823 RepID=A0AAF0JDA3_9BASI|nr:hypothetical protein MPSI1_000818 [Malassezia psittaci]